MLDRDQLIDLVKGREWAGYDRGLDTQVMRLRKKTEPDPSNSSLIKMVRDFRLCFRRGRRRHHSPVNKRWISGIA